MLQEGGLGAQINQKADAYRSNPDALQKKAKLSGDLMDALALQKVMSDKAMAKQQLALSQQQDAGSVVEQMEQKLVGMNKEELTAQTAGIMGERNKQKQKQISAAAPPKPQGQRPPMPQGAPQGLPAAPRPPMQMAQGGIIGYAAGGITNSDIKKWLEDNPNVFPQGSDDVRREAAIKALNKEVASKRKSAPVSTQERVEFRKNNPDVFPEAEDSTIDKLIRKEKFGERSLSPEPARKVGTGGLSNAQSSALQGAMEIGGADLGAGVSGIAAEAKKKQAAMEAQNQPSGVLKPGGIPSVPDMGGAGVLRPPVDPNAATAPAPAVPTTPTDKMLGEVGLDVAGLTATPDVSSANKKAVSGALGEEFMGALSKDVTQDPDDKRKSTKERMDKDLNRSGIASRYAGYESQQKALDDAELDPETLRKRKDEAYWLGVRKGGGLGGAMAKANFDSNISKSRQASLTKQIDLFEKGAKVDIEIATASNKEAGLALKAAMEERSAAMKTVASIAADDQAMYNKEVDRMYNSNQNGIKNKIDALKVRVEARLQEMIQKQASATEIGREIRGLEAESTKLREEFFKSVQPQLVILRQKQADGELEEKDRKLLARYEYEYQRLKAKTRMDEALDLLNQLLQQQVDQGGYANTITNRVETEDTEEDEISSLVKQYQTSKAST